MSVPHHGDDQNRDDLIKRFFKQGEGEANREWPNGRLGGEDDGSLVFAIAADPKRQVIKIDFNKPVKWIGLDKESAEKLRDMLTDKLLELRGITY